MKKLSVFLLVVVFSLNSCVNSGLKNERENPDDLPRPLTAAEQKLITSGRQFSFDIFHNIASADENKNVFISPLSISMALGMTLNGAVDETKAGIKKTLSMSDMELQAINRSYKSLTELLLTLDPKVKIGIGNSIWSRKELTVYPSFKDTLKKYFNARAEALDFGDPATVDIINNWVEEQTYGRIDQIVKEIPDYVVMYLINAIYFKADWLYKFDKEKTKPEPFNLDEGSTVEVEMMNQKLPLIMYKSDKVHMANIAYGDSLFQMTVLMPADAGVSINEFIANSLTADNLRQWTSRLQVVENVKLKLPRFETDYKITLNQILKSMGMARAFDEKKADFSKIGPAGLRMFISTVLHKANITVNEEGTEAAAATKVGIGLTSVGSEPSFYANRPFVYMIRERISGTILFMGVMRNPNK